MPLLIFTFLVTTLGECAGIIWWMACLQDGNYVAGFLGLAAGEAIEVSMFVYYLSRSAGTGNGRSFPRVLGVMVLIALFELSVWGFWWMSYLHWHYLASVGVLFVLMHLKHDADVTNIADTTIGRAWFTAKGFAATGLETLGALLAIYFVSHDQLILGACLLIACIMVEHFFGGLIVAEQLAGRHFLAENPERTTSKQNALTVVSPVDPYRVGELTKLLRELGTTIGTDPRFPANNLTRVHFCCWFIANHENQPILIMEANFDGPAETFLVELVDTVESALAEIYAHCQAMPNQPTKEQIAEYMKTHRVSTHTFFIGVHGLTAEEIRQDALLRSKIETFVDQQQADKTFNETSDPQHVRRQIQAFVERDPELAFTRKKPPAPPWNVVHGPTWVRRFLVFAAVVALGIIAVSLYGLGGLVFPYEAPIWTIVTGLVLVAFLLLGGLFVARLRWLEESDPQPDWPNLFRPDRDVFIRENQQPLNHLANVAPLKRGLVRTVTIRVILLLVHWVARLLQNRGELAGTRTIHFARWAVINGGSDLLFCSNYDGSWERYLSDFVDRSSIGLTAIWGNTIEFPRTRWLVQGGAADDVNFKAAARRRQLESLLWYSAYPELTMRNIHNNQMLRRGLLGELDDEGVKAWLRRL